MLLIYQGRYSDLPSFKHSFSGLLRLWHWPPVIFKSIQIQPNSVGNVFPKFFQRIACSETTRKLFDLSPKAIRFVVLCVNYYGEASHFTTSKQTRELLHGQPCLF